MQVNGSCHCGKITFRANIEPDDTRICHCSDCQTISGSPFRVVVPVSENDFDLLTGEPKIYIKVAESGNKREQAFCADCGTPIYATSVGGSSRVLGLRVGALKESGQLEPTHQYWARSAVDWMPDFPNTKKIDTQ